MQKVMCRLDPDLRGSGDRVTLEGPEGQNINGVLGRTVVDPEGFVVANSREQLQSNLADILDAWAEGKLRRAVYYPPELIAECSIPDIATLVKGLCATLLPGFLSAFSESCLEKDEQPVLPLADKIFWSIDGEEKQPTKVQGLWPSLYWTTAKVRLHEDRLQTVSEAAHRIADQISATSELLCQQAVTAAEDDHTMSIRSPTDSALDHLRMRVLRWGLFPEFYGTVGVWARALRVVEGLYFPQKFPLHRLVYGHHFTKFLGTAATVIDEDTELRLWAISRHHCHHFVRVPMYGQEIQEQLLDETPVAGLFIGQYHGQAITCSRAVASALLVD